MNSNMNPMQLMQMLKSGNLQSFVFQMQEYFDKINWGFL